MKLYLVRHAIAEARDPNLWPDDSQRPLSKRGVKRFRKAAHGLQALVPEVDAVLSSPYERAWHTAAILEKAGWPAPTAFSELTLDDPVTVLRALEPYANAAALVLVGHEPRLSRFAAVLLGWSRVPWRQLKKGGVLCLEQDALDLEAGAEVSWLLPPRVLRALSWSGDRHRA